MSERFGHSVDGIEYDFKFLYGCIGSPAGGVDGWRAVRSAFEVLISLEAFYSIIDI